jgi:predicted porin
MNTKTKLIAGIALGVIIALFAYKKINAEELPGNFSLGYNSELSFRGVAAETSAIQSSLSLDANILGLDVGLGAATNIKDVGKNETRLSAETGVTILDSVSTSVGVVKYGNNHAVGDDTELFITLGAEIILSPEVKLFYNPSEAHTTVEGSVSQVIEITDEISVEAVGSVGNTTIGGDWGLYYGLDVIAGYSLGDNTKAYVGIDLKDLKDINMEAPELAFVAGITHQF